jgi:hypothetical protein
MSVVIGLLILAFLGYLSIKILYWIFLVLRAIVRGLFGTRSSTERSAGRIHVQPQQSRPTNGQSTAPARGVVPNGARHRIVRVAKRNRICAACKTNLNPGEAVVKCTINGGHTVHSVCRSLVNGKCPHCGHDLNDQSIKF